MLGGIDPVSFSVLILAVAAIAWIYGLVRTLEQRLTTLEKEHMALVAELEDRLYQPSPGG